MGEFDFIEMLRRSFAGIGDGAITGIGDDCAVIPLPGGAKSAGESLVVTADMLIEGVHFLHHATSARELGAKSLAVNLSDVAAMGARPVASLLSLALPPECRDAWAEEFMEGYRELSARHGVKLAGGDTTASLNGIAINVTLIGRAPDSRLKYRSGACTGDIVAVNGPLGESAAGLRDIMDGHPDTPFAAVHRNPVPQVEEGTWLGARTEVHSMIDLSDGLASDLVHILKASGKGATESADSAGVGAEIELSAIPTPVSFELAITGGEDYKLLFTASPGNWEKLRADYRARFGSDLHAVGRIVAGPPSITWLQDGAPVSKNWRGFIHF